jgi:hypothetical protein
VIFRCSSHPITSPRRPCVVCRPPDLTAPTEVTLNAPPSAAVEAVQLLWGNGVALTPAYLFFTAPNQFSGRGAQTLSENHTLFSFTYSEVNNGAWASLQPPNPTSVRARISYAV